MAKVRELRSLIYRRYDTESDMAAAIGWTRQRLSKITNGIKEPNVEELDCMARGLNRSVEEIAQIFLRAKSPNGQHYEEMRSGNSARAKPWHTIAQATESERP